MFSIFSFGLSICLLFGLQISVHCLPINSKPLPIKRAENVFKSGTGDLDWKNELMEKKYNLNVFFFKRDTKAPHYNLMLPSAPPPQPKPQPRPHFWPKPQPRPLFKPKWSPKPINPWKPQKRDEKHKAYGEMLNVAGVVTSGTSTSILNCLLDGTVAVPAPTGNQSPTRGSTQPTTIRSSIKKDAKYHSEKAKKASTSSHVWATAIRGDVDYTSHNLSKGKYKEAVSGVVSACVAGVSVLSCLLASTIALPTPTVSNLGFPPHELGTLAIPGPTSSTPGRLLHESTQSTTSRSAAKGRKYHSFKANVSAMASRLWARTAKGNARYAIYNLGKGNLREAASSAGSASIASPAQSDDHSEISYQMKKGKTYHSKEAYTSSQLSKDWVRGAIGNARITAYHLKEGFLKEAAYSTAAACGAGMNCAKNKVKSVYHDTASKLSQAPLFNGLMEQILATPIPTGSRNNSPTRRPSTPTHTSGGGSSTGQQDAPPVKNKQYHTSRAATAKDDVNIVGSWTKGIARDTGNAFKKHEYGTALAGVGLTCLEGIACAARGIGYAHHKNKAKNASQ
ncbi:uncharacterized protein FA14DRAFT_181875 [Meira miltonrushii]|uniref:SCP domain-containing protein n=1 Tax=Meira miltonrushii TaxID=1280837 RepID=A0A316V907_9BASI|nr:uncharacterized protein FA14DRAFT_181875 [Meira miltonrushii]PWN31955.1 hypothetical protein FA14DRAFT_181875 [Meira miltonrushii]